MRPRRCGREGPWLSCGASAALCGRRRGVAGCGRPQEVPGQARPLAAAAVAAAAAAAGGAWPLPDPAVPFRVHCRTMMRGAASGCVPQPSLMTLQARRQQGGGSRAAMASCMPKAGRHAAKTLHPQLMPLTLRCAALPALQRWTMTRMKTTRQAASCVSQPVHPQTPLPNLLSPPAACRCLLNSP